MKLLKNIKLVIFILLILLVLVVLRLSNQNLFKRDAQAAITAFENNKNLISVTELKTRYTNYLLLNLSDEIDLDLLNSKHSLQISYSELLEKSNREKLNKAGEIILYSKDVSETARAWVILNQLNYKHVFILQTQDSVEVLKYKFRPNQSIRPE